jgi:hypothetical protein
MKKQYLTCCVYSTAEKINNMVDNARQISFKTFMKHAELADTEFFHIYAWGQQRGLHLKDDWAVSYYKGKYEGQPCVYMCHSAIEYNTTISLYVTHIFV